MPVMVLFAHDGPLYSNDARTYYGVHFNDELRLRYLQLGTHVTFIMRVYPFNGSELNRLSQITNDRFKVVSVPNFKSIRLYFKIKPLASVIIEKSVQESDVVVARMPSAIGTLAMKHAKKYNKPVLVEYVACTFDAYWNYNWKGKLIAHYKMFEQKRIMRTVRYAIYVTQNFLQRRYPTRGYSIGCSDVELPAQNDLALQSRLSKINQFDFQRPLVLGTVAALDVPYKGQADVIKALDRLRKMSIRFKYLLVGQGDSKRLTNLIEKLRLQDCVEIIGPLKHEEVFAFYEKIDLYIQPSKQEGLPRALIEAMSIACPSLGARTAGIPELLHEKMIFEKGDIRGIAEKLKTITRDLMLSEAKRNFSTAAQYQRDMLAHRRSAFYMNFLKENNLFIERE